MRRQALRRLATVLALAAVPVGCKTRASLPPSDADALRSRTVELERQVTDLERRNAELETQLARHAGGDAETEAVRSATPHVARITIGRLSHVRAAAGADPVLIAYVKPEDGYGRFVQLVGRMSANVAILPSQADAFSIGRLELEPLEVRDAYRSSVTGTHYTVEIPIDPEDLGAYRECTVRVEYVDGRSGRRHAADRAVALGSR